MPIRRPRRPLTVSRHALEMLEPRQMLHGGIAPTLTLHTNQGEITLSMLDQLAPATVANFVNYAKDGDFNDVIFHRSVPGFVLQGGGFRSTAEDLCACAPADFTAAQVSASQFNEVPTDPPVVNEFNHSNVRGTVAMAKLGGDPNSATNQFFFNLANNSSNLDNQNGGFTVFAEVQDMTVVDAIAALPRRNLASIFPSGSRLKALSEVATFTSGTTGNVAAVRIESITGKGLIEGTVYMDVDEDGVKDGAEGGFTRAQVFVDTNDNGKLDTGEPTTTAENTGEYNFLLEPGLHVIRPVPIDGHSHTDASKVQGHRIQVEMGVRYEGMDIGLLYKGSSWKNARIAEDVDGVNGVSPLDALLVINELTNRVVSNTETGQLPAITQMTPPIRFLDVTGDQIVAPLDALLVINSLGQNAAMGVVVTDDEGRSGSVQSEVGLGSTSIDLPFAGIGQTARIGDTHQDADETVSPLDTFFATLGA